VIEAVSNPWIRLEGKVQVDEKAEHTRQVVSILRKPATQPSGLGRSFEMASNQLMLTTGNPHQHE